MANLDPIRETTYLSAQNAVQYRTIMRIFYRENERLHYRLYREDDLELLRAEEGVSDYTAAQLDLDLKNLTEWKNLTAVQDPGQVYSIEQYRKKKYCYMMTDTAVEIERMCLRLEDLVLTPGSLSTNLFLRLEKSLEELKGLESAQEKQALDWWDNLQEDFKRLNQNYKDYLREFYSSRTRRLMKSVEFLLHKDRLIEYLNDFVQEMQRHARRIGRILAAEGPHVRRDILPRAAHSAAEIPHAAGDAANEEEILTTFLEQWDSLENWFLDHDGETSEYKEILAITGDIIRNIIENAALIVQVQNWGISRKDDYRTFLHLFEEAPDLETAHRISAHVFGIQQIEHLKENALRDSDDPNGSVYDEEPFTYQIKPRVRSFRERRQGQIFEDRTEEKKRERAAYQLRKDEEQRVVLRYIKDGLLDLAAIDEIVPQQVRAILLHWIQTAGFDGERRGFTEYGQQFILRQNPGECVLHCEDGELQMPAFVLDFHVPPEEDRRRAGVIERRRKAPGTGAEDGETADETGSERGEEGPSWTD